MGSYHTTVLLNETIDLLSPVPGGIYVDATLGGGGHFKEIIKRTQGKGTFIGIDQDEDAIKKVKADFSGIDVNNIHLIRENFKNIKDIVRDLNIQYIDGIVYDLGVSSYQLDEETRGFSYMKDAPLDMRMDNRSELTAEHVVNQMPREELKRIIKLYGEEAWADRIAEFICKRREKEPIKTTGELVDIIKAAIPARARRRGPHPAKRTFQALRVYVNKELEILESSIKDAVSILRPGGRICIITFHSLEDRIVKNTFKDFARDCICPKGTIICTCHHKKTLKILTSKPVCPTDEEIDRNPRARSAKLRAAEKIMSSKSFKE